MFDSTVTLADLFKMADSIGDKYLTAEEIEQREADMEAVAVAMAED